MNFKNIILLLLLNLALATYLKAENYKNPNSNLNVKVSWHIEKLISKTGEKEKFEKITPENENIKLALKYNKLPEGAIEYEFTAHNNGNKKLYLRPVATIDIPQGEFSCWNGYNYMRKISFDKNDTNLSNWFPACAAYNKENAIVLGINPIYLYSRIESGKLSTSKGEKLYINLPFILEPKSTFKYSFVVSTCRSRYGYRDIVQHWYDVFPEAFNPADGIDQNVISGESSFMYWYPKTINEKYTEDLIRRMFAGRGSWEWCYKPFIRGGDWAITDKWSVGWRGWNKKRVDDHRKKIHARLKTAENLNIAPMWYLNVTWTEWDIWKNHFPNICPEKKPRKRRCWGQDTLLGVYSWGNDYAKLFIESINRIPKEYPASRGIGWDSCFAHNIFYQDVDGVKNTDCKSFLEGRIFALEGVGVANLLDLNHKNFSGKYRMANVVNFKLVTPYMIGARSDAALYEGNPTRTNDRHLRIESMRARLGTRKAMVWHKGALPKYIRWVDWEDMDAEEAKDVYAQLMENVLFCNYYWGATSAPGLPTLGIQALFKAVPELVDLIRQGWQPSPGVDADNDLLIARYGKGVGSRLVLTNPRFKEIKTKLTFRSDYWNQKALILGREDGEILNSTITPEETSTTLTLAPRKIIIIRVCGTGELANSGIKDLSVKSQKITNSGKAPLWNFALNTNDKINCQVDFYRNSRDATVKLRDNKTRQKFSPSSKPTLKLNSSEWMDDIQAGAKRSTLIELYEYPVYSTEKLTNEAIKDLKLLDNLKAGKLAIITAKNASPQIKTEAKKISEWFKFYTSVSNMPYHEPQVIDSPLSKGISIKLEMNKGRLKAWEKGRVELIAENIISIIARDETELQKTISKFLGRLDKIYPYYGKLPETELLQKMGLAGKTLKPQKAKNVFHPTLLEMFRKTRVKK
jgi:hypothetical protein